MVIRFSSPWFMSSTVIKNYLCTDIYIYIPALTTDRSLRDSCFESSSILWNRADTGQRLSTLITMNQTLPSDFAEFSHYTAIAHWIYRIWTAGFAFLSLLGNTLALLIFVRWAHRLSIYIYFTGVCLVNILIVNIDMTFQYLLPILVNQEYMIKTLLPVTCRFMLFLTYFFRYIFIWLIVMINIDRCLYLTEIRSKPGSCKQRTAIRICVALTVLSLVANVHFLIFLNQPWLIDVPSNDTCLMDGYLSSCRSENTNYQYFYDYIWPIYNALLFAIIPTTIMFVCCALIIRNIYAAKKYLLTFDARRGSSSSTISHNAHLRSIAKTLICLDLIFPLTIFPVLSFQLYLNYNPPESCRSIGIVNLISSLALAITYTKNTFAFLIYYCTGSKFRRAFSALIRCRSIDPKNETLWHTLSCFVRRALRLRRWSGK